MSEFCYIIDDQKGSRLFLSSEGPRKDGAALVEQLSQDGFRHMEERRIGSCVLHVFERAMQATDIVAPECETSARR
jgi:hypothetical protein